MTRRRNIEFARRRMRLGLTQAMLAERLTAVVQRAGSRWEHAIVTREYVYRLESGRVTWPGPVYRAALRSVLGVTDEAELGLYCQRVGSELEEENVRRRDFLATLPAVALTGTSVGDLVAAAMAEPAAPPRRVGLEQVQQVRELDQQANALDWRYGGGLVREVLAGQVRWAVSLFDSHVDRAAEAPLASAVGELCKTAAWASHDDGAHAAANHYHAAALRCAERADDWDLRAYLLGDMAQVAAQCGLGDEALTFAQQAQLRSDRLGPFRLTRLALKEAHAHGRCGDTQACLSAIGLAQDGWARSGMGNEGRSSDFHFSSAELLGDATHALHPLAVRGEAVATTIAYLREAIATYPANVPRARAMATTRLATLLMRHGDPAEAVQFGDQALTAASTIRSARLTETLRQLHHATTRHRGNLAVDDLRHRTARTLAA